METLRDNYKDEDDEDTEKSTNDLLDQTQTSITTLTPSTPTDNDTTTTTNLTKDEPDISDDLSHSSEASDASDASDEQPPHQLHSSTPPTVDLDDDDDNDDDEENTPRKKQKPLSSFQPPPQTTPIPSSITPTDTMQSSTPLPSSATAAKKPKKKNNNVWTKPTSRKGKKKPKTNTSNNGSASAAAAAAAATGGAIADDAVVITPIPRFPDRSDDSPDLNICLSKVNKAEKVELSEDRLSAGSCKGYRMVRATRGVEEGAWYFEIKVSNLGETGHTRLGWCMEKGDLQAPVGYDVNSFGYRDIDGSKVHKALREKYGESGYVEGDVIGFYINLPAGALYAPKPPKYAWYKGQRYMCTTDGKEEAPKVVPGSEISFFKNGICQGTAFKDLFGGRYYPAASMYTLPNQPNCVVKFNFGPEFECFPQDFNDRTIPRPMIEVPYFAVDGKIENVELNEKGH